MENNNKSITHMLNLQEGIENAWEAHKASHEYGKIPRLNDKQVEMVKLLASGRYGECDQTFKKSSGHFSEHCSEGLSNYRYDSVDITIKNPFGLTEVEELTFTISYWMVSLSYPYKIGFLFDYNRPHELLERIKRVVVNW